MQVIHKCYAIVNKGLDWRGLERLSRSQECVLLFPKTRVWFPGPMSGSSQQPVNTISKVSNVFPLLASTGTCTLSNIYPHRPMCMYRIKHKFFKKDLIGEGVWYTGVSRDKLLRKDHIVLRENLLVSRIFSSLTISFFSVLISRWERLPISLNSCYQFMDQTFWVKHPETPCKHIQHAHETEHTRAHKRGATKLSNERHHSDRKMNMGSVSCSQMLQSHPLEREAFDGARLVPHLGSHCLQQQTD